MMGCSFRVGIYAERMQIASQTVLEADGRAFIDDSMGKKVRWVAVINAKPVVQEMTSFAQTVEVPRFRTQDVLEDGETVADAAARIAAGVSDGDVTAYVWEWPNGWAGIGYII